MAVWYLDNDDEITDAVARLRGATDEHVVFVVPSGSRIATGRLNFKLLAREAQSRDLRMAVASPDEQVRAMAASAGVLALASADEAEASLVRGDPAPEPSSADAVPPIHRDPVVPAAQPARRGPMRRPSGRGLAATAVVVLAAALIGGYAALQTLPTAQITLAPRIAELGPIEVLVTASAAVAEPDAGAGRVPATELPIPLRIERTFPASGSEVTATPATGEVVFSSGVTFQDIAAGTRVMTPSGIEFRTTELVSLARSADGTAPGVVAAPIVAVEAGDDGNVAAATITVAPSLETQDISVTNPDPTSGGRLEETPRVTAQDYDDAAADLNNRLAGELAAHLRDPANTPEGLTLFPETGLLGPVTHMPRAAELVGSDAADFSLSGSAAASVLAVDERLVDEVTRTRLLEALSEGMAILADSVSIEVGEGSAEGRQVRFRSVAEGDSYRPVDRSAILEQVAGLPISEAQAILEAIGTTTVSVWPDFLGDLPGDTSRITLDVREPSTTE